MRPLTDLLIRRSAELHAGLDVAYISHRNLTHSFGMTEVNHLAGSLVQQVALLAVESSADLRLALEQSPGPPRAGLATTQSFLRRRMPFVAFLFAGAQHAPPTLPAHAAE